MGCQWLVAYGLGTCPCKIWDIPPHEVFCYENENFDSSVSARCLDTGSFSVFVLQRQQRTRPARATDIARHDR